MDDLGKRNAMAPSEVPPFTKLGVKLSVPTGACMPIQTPPPVLAPARASSSNGSFHGAEFPKRGTRKWMPMVFERRYRSSYTGRLDTWFEFTVIS